MQKSGIFSGDGVDPRLDINIIISVDYLFILSLFFYPNPAPNRRSSNRNVFRWLGIYRAEAEKVAGARLGGRVSRVSARRVAVGGNPVAFPRLDGTFHQRIVCHSRCLGIAATVRYHRRTDGGSLRVSSGLAIRLGHPVPVDYPSR